MENIKNYQQKQEQYQSIKPAIKTPLLFLSTLISNIILWIFLTIWIILGILATLGPIGLIIVPILFALTFIGIFYIKKASLNQLEYKFYTNRIEYADGFLVKNRKTINYDKISNISQTKGILEGFFNLGTIKIDTAGSSSTGHELSMFWIENPDSIYDWISKIISKQ